jgi:hypothetical protein
MLVSGEAGHGNKSSSALPPDTSNYGIIATADKGPSSNYQLTSLAQSGGGGSAAAPATATYDRLLPDSARGTGLGSSGGAGASGGQVNYDQLLPESTGGNGSRASNAVQAPTYAQLLPDSARQSTVTPPSVNYDQLPPDDMRRSGATPSSGQAPYATFKEVGTNTNDDEEDMDTSDNEHDN